MIVVEFVNDAVFMAPARALQGLIDATESEIAEVGLVGGTHLHWKRRATCHEIAKLVSGYFGTLDSTGVCAESAAEADGHQGTSVQQWVAPVIQFLSDNLPGNSKTRWYHDFVTAYQTGCETLIALGQAEETTDRQAFLVSLMGLSGERRRDGAYGWGVTEDAADPGLILEWFMVESWAEHLRQHRRVSRADADLQGEVRKFHKAPVAPAVRHFLAINRPEPPPPAK